MLSRESLLEEITLIFRQELEDETIVLSMNSSASSIEKWDSMNNLVLISAIEQKYGLEFPIETIFNARNIGDLCDFIVAKKMTE